MPITVPVSVHIELDPVPGVASSAPEPRVWGWVVCIQEQPGLDSQTLVLSVPDPRGQQEAELDSEDVERMLGLLRKIPAESMDVPCSSFDGRTYQVQIIRRGQANAYSWGNEDWRYATDCPQEAWAALQELVDFCLGRAEALLQAG